MAFCNQCGTELASGAKFCPKCGTPVAVQQAAPAPAAQPHIAQQTAPADQYNFSSYQQPAPQVTLKQKAKISPYLRLVGIVAAILIGISVFLPYANASIFGFSASITLMDGEADAYIFLGIAVVALIFAAANLGIGQIIMGFCAIGGELIEWSNGASRLAKRGIGYYTILIGAILLIVGGVAVFIAKHKAKKALRANN